SRTLVADEFGFKGVATYFAKKSKGVFRKYTCSKNLVKPEEKTRDGVVGKRAIDSIIRNYEIGVEKLEKLKSLKDYKVLKMVSKVSEYVAGAYVYITMKRRN
ncbi:MAG: hypothetical protein RR458_06830, partial [Clostridia bacterium]